MGILWVPMGMSKQPIALPMFFLSVGCSGPEVLEVGISDNPDMVLEKVMSVTLSEPAAVLSVSSAAVESRRSLQATTTEASSTGTAKAWLLLDIR